MCSRSDLEKKLLELTNVNERLTEENALLKFELKELKDRVYGRRPKKDPPPPSAPAVPPRKRGALFGHLGWFRKNPDKIHKIVDVRLDECPLLGVNTTTTIPVRVLSGGFLGKDIQ